MDDAAWMHYRVERETEDVGRTEGPSAGAIAKEVAKTALFPRIPKFGPAKIAKDTVKIFNRSGEVVAALPFDSHSESDKTEQRVVDDLVNMSALEFRVKYGIDDAPAEVAGTVPVVAPAGSAASHPASLAAAEYRIERLRSIVQTSGSPGGRLFTFGLRRKMASASLGAQMTRSVDVPAPPGWQPAKGPPLPLGSDVLRIVDRDGNVAHTITLAGEEQAQQVQQQLINDLTTLDPASFRAKYGIAE